MISAFIRGGREYVEKKRVKIFRSYIRPCLISKKFCKIFSDSLSHRIFRRMHEVLNIDENKN